MSTSVRSFGDFTDVPRHTICRLSFYLRCVTMGCGLNFQFDMALLDFEHAHRFPRESQQQIFELASGVFNLGTMLNQIIFLVEDGNTLLRDGSSNAFYEVETVSDTFSINGFASIAGQQRQVTKVMLCTNEWLRFYYEVPIVQFQAQPVPASNNRTAEVNINQGGTSTGEQGPSSSVSPSNQNDPNQDQTIPDIIVSGPRPGTVQEVSQSNEHQTAGMDGEDSTDPNPQLTSELAEQFPPGLQVRVVGLSAMPEWNGLGATVRLAVGSRVVVRLAALGQSVSVHPQNLVVEYSPGMIGRLINMENPDLNGQISVVLSVNAATSPRILHVQLSSNSDIIIEIPQTNFEHMRQLD